VHGKMINVIIAHAIFLTALPLITVSLGLESVSKEMIEAGRTLGADDRTVFRTVTLPIILPYLISGFAFAFVLSLNEYIIAFMTVGFTVETLPIKIFNSLRYGYTPVMASVAVLFIMINVVIFGLIGRFGNLPKLLGAWSEER
jgi:putative spermidine/putrescine transport system permease protein